MAKNTSVWLIIPQTNLHVGNESVVSFSIIDKAIQRDATTHYPCIHASSLKGALKAHLTHRADATNQQEISETNIQKIFGSIKDKGDICKGSAIFFDANLLFIPKQCTDGNVAYQLVYNEEVLKAFLSKANLMQASLSLENLTNTVRNLEHNIIDDATINIDCEKFKALTKDDALPIIARNCLENGQSENLWYEQVLPSHSVLATIIQTEGDNDLDCLNDQIVQIGANATIGYGYCKLIKL